jgi:phosphopantothenoylcysteine synthetase/decarboxylase
MAKPRVKAGLGTPTLISRLESSTKVGCVPPREPEFHMSDQTRQFLITAGGTREAIDRVRDWGNVFTGNTGYAIARAVADVGPVTLLTSNAQHLAELAGPQTTRHPIHPVAFRSYDDLRQSLEQLMTAQRFDGVFMIAAVSDYTPAGAYQIVERRPDPAGDGTETWIVRSAQAGKVKSTFDQIAILGQRTEKLVDMFRTRWRFTGLLVKLKLEVGVSRERLIEIGQASRKASGADYLVANTLDMVDGPDAGAYLLSDCGEVHIKRGDLPAAMAALCKK